MIATNNCIEFSKLSTKVTERDRKTAIKDIDGVLYSPDGLRLLDGRNCCSDNYSVKEGTIIICDYAFCKCEDLESITVNESDKTTSNPNVTDYKRLLFEKKHGEGRLNSINLPHSITAIGDSAFYGCTNLFDLFLPNKLEKIGNLCFFKTSLQKIVLPRSLRSISGNPICQISSKMNNDDIVSSKLEKTIKIKCLSPYFVVENNNLYSSDKKTLISFLSNDKNFVIPKFVTKIGRNAFSGNKYLISVTISSNVEQIESNPFVGTDIQLINKSNYFILKDDILYTRNYETLVCSFSKKEIINIPYSVRVIGERAFMGNRNAIKIKVPYSVETICDSAFFNCTNIRRMKLPNSVKNMGGSVFSGCKNLKDIKMPQYLRSLGDCIFKGCISLQNVVLPGYLRNIGCATFFQCIQLENLSLPDSLTGIGKLAFYACTRLKNISIPESVKIIGETAFWHCNSLQSVVLSNNLIEIGVGAFSNCLYIEEVVIPKSVRFIGLGAFYKCIRLKTLYIPDSVKNIGQYAFKGCKMQITSTKIGRYIRNEYSCINLIATTPGNKERLKKMLPKYLHDVIEELTYKEFMERSKHSKNSNAVEEYEYGSLEKVKCPRCGEWYYEDDGVCDTCGYPWNE